ncbi:MAG: hypothetical protein ABI847_06625, partial [Anaerolineales bacterium]
MLSLSGLLMLAALVAARVAPLSVAEAPLPALFSTVQFLTHAPPGTAQPSSTVVPSTTFTPTPSQTATPSATFSPTATGTPSPTRTPRPTPTRTHTPPPSETRPPTNTAPPTKTAPPASPAPPTNTPPPATVTTAPPSPTQTAPPVPTATPIPPAANAFWGVNGGPIDGGSSGVPFDGNLSHNAPLRAKSFYWMAQAGLNWFRNYASDGIDYSWRFVEPAPGQYDWSAWDLLAAESQRQGVSLLAEIGNSVPAWANGSQNWRDKPLDLYAEPMAGSSWYQFVSSMVERYDGDGQADMPGLTRPIKYWEIWNEPDLREGWNPPDYPAHQFNGTVADTVRLLQVAYAAVKAADPG